MINWIKQHKVPLIFLIAIILLVAAITVVVAQYVMTSNTVQVTPVSQASLSLATNTTSPVLGESVLLTATCSDTGFTGTVAFTANGNSIGSSSATAGVATLTWAPPSVTTYNVQASATHP